MKALYVLCLALRCHLAPPRLSEESSRSCEMMKEFDDLPKPDRLPVIVQEAVPTIIQDQE